MSKETAHSAEWTVVTFPGLFQVIILRHMQKNHQNSTFLKKSIFSKNKNTDFWLQVAYGAI